MKRALRSAAVLFGCLSVLSVPASALANASPTDSLELVASPSLLAQAPGAALPPLPASPAPVAVDRPARMGVFIDPLAIGVGIGYGMLNLAIRFQYAINDFFGIFVAPVIAYYKPSNVTVWGGGGEVGLHFSLSKRKLSGWFLRPFASVAYATGSDSSGDSASLGGFAAGAEVGYSWTWAPGFAMNLGAGVQYMTYFAASRSSGAQLSVEITPVLPRLSFSIGYAW